MATNYYFISDLHIGGDGALDECPFESELIAFLRQLEAEAEDAELIIAGDMFGLWETTYAEGPDKLHGIIAGHTDLFLQFQRTGKRVRITIIPGNHDHELATDPEFASILRVYNLHLEATEHITRDIAGRTIWIEHGNQHDSYNRFDDFGNPACRPLGYYVTSGVISGASRRVKGRDEKWLKDIGSVYPTEYVPHWLLSNYFYREMSTYIRALAAPFLLLFSVNVILVCGVLLELAGLLPHGWLLSSFTRSLGAPGYLLDALFLINGVAVVAILLLSIPLFLVRRDIRGVLLRYGVDLSEALKAEKKTQYANAADRVFREFPDVILFVFGHTHTAGVQVCNGHAIVNTGAWLKQLTCVASRFYMLPDVYCPSFELGYFHVSADGDRLLIRYERIPKTAPDELSLLQRVSIYGRCRQPAPPAPAMTVLPLRETMQEPASAEEPRNQVEHEGNYHAQDDARDDGKVE